MNNSGGEAITTERSKKKAGFWQQQWWIVIVVVVAIGCLLDQTVVWDFWRGLGYSPDAAVQEIEESLELTGTGRRIFAATRPAVKDAAGFNESCGEHNSDVSVLGCYADGQIYIYRITDEQLALANKVTAAHELLHAVWERMGTIEREEVKGWLNEVREQNAEWFGEELETYNTEDEIEEVYTRAGTKLAELPEGLEKHYAKFFKNRGRIVEMYKTYEAPFEKLRSEISALYDEIERVRLEIETEREEYNRDVDALDVKIDRFNACANTMNCFTAAEFNAQRSGLMIEREALEVRRVELNKKIDENNARIDEYASRQDALGGLYDLMDSNIEHVESEQEI